MVAILSVPANADEWLARRSGDKVVASQDKGNLPDPFFKVKARAIISSSGYWQKKEISKAEDFLPCIKFASCLYENYEDKFDEPQVEKIKEVANRKFSDDIVFCAETKEVILDALCKSKIADLNSLKNNAEIRELFSSYPLLQDVISLVKTYRKIGSDKEGCDEYINRFLKALLREKSFFKALKIVCRNRPDTYDDQGFGLFNGYLYNPYEDFFDQCIELGELDVAFQFALHYLGNKDQKNALDNLFKKRPDAGAIDLARKIIAAGGSHLYALKYLVKNETNKKAFQNALDIAQINGNKERDALLCVVSIEATKANESDIALDAAQLISDKKHKIEALKYYAKDQAQKGEYLSAMKLAAEIKELECDQESSFEASGLLFKDISIEATKANESDIALDAAQLISDKKHKIEALKYFAKDQALKGRYSKAMEIAAEIKELECDRQVLFEASDLLESISEMAIKAKKPDIALDAAQLISDKKHKIEALKYFAKDQALKGKYSNAMEIVAEIKELKCDQESSFEALNLYIYISAIAAKSGDLEKALEIVLYVHTIHDKKNDHNIDYKLKSALEFIAKKHLECEDYAAAIDIADRMKEMKLESGGLFKDISIHATDSDKLDIALTKALLIDIDDRNRTRALQHLAEKWIEKADPNMAMEVVLKIFDKDSDWVFYSSSIEKLVLRILEKLVEAKDCDGLENVVSKCEKIENSEFYITKICEFVAAKLAEESRIDKAIEIAKKMSIRSKNDELFQQRVYAFISMQAAKAGEFEKSFEIEERFTKNIDLSFIDSILLTNRLIFGKWKFTTKNERLSNIHELKNKAYQKAQRLAEEALEAKNIDDIVKAVRDSPDRKKLYAFILIKAIDSNDILTEITGRRNECLQDSIALEPPH